MNESKGRNLRKLIGFLGRRIKCFEKSITLGYQLSFSPTKPATGSVQRIVCDVADAFIHASLSPRSRDIGVDSIAARREKFLVCYRFARRVYIYSRNSHGTTPIASRNLTSVKEREEVLGMIKAIILYIYNLDIMQKL